MLREPWPLFMPWQRLALILHDQALSCCGGRIFRLGSAKPWLLLLYVLSKPTLHVAVILAFWPRSEPSAAAHGMHVRPGSQYAVYTSELGMPKQQTWQVRHIGKHTGVVTHDQSISLGCPRHYCEIQLLAIILFMTADVCVV